MFRKASAHDLDAVVSIYDKIHAREDAGLTTIGWITGVYPIRQDAQEALARGDLYVYEQDGRVVASGIINQRQVDVYADGNWLFSAPDDKVMVLHTLTVDPDCGGRGHRPRVCAVLRAVREGRGLHRPSHRYQRAQHRRAPSLREPRLPRGGYRDL